MEQRKTSGAREALIGLASMSTRQPRWCRVSSDSVSSGLCSTVPIVGPGAMHRGVELPPLTCLCNPDCKFQPRDRRKL